MTPCLRRTCLDSDDSLPEENMPAGCVHVVVDWVSRVDNQAVHELHSLSSLPTKLARHHDLAALGSRLHDESEDTIAGPPHGESTNELVAQRLGLSDGAQASGGDLLGVQLNVALGEVETLLHHRGQLADSASLLSEHILCPGGHDDDLCPGGSHSHLDTAVAILGKFTSQELVQLGLEHAVVHELSFLGNLDCHSFSLVEVNQAIL